MIVNSFAFKGKAVAYRSITLIFIILTKLLAPVSNAQYSQYANRFVEEKVSRGQWADLTELDTEESSPSHRKIAFTLLLKDLLTTKQRSQRVRIKNAIIVEPVNFEDVDIPNKIQFIDCIFVKNFRCVRTKFQKSVIFKNCTFNGMSLKDCDFNEELNFTSSTFNKQKSNSQITNFYRLNINNALLIDDAKFKQTLSIYGSSIRTVLTANKTNFEAEDSSPFTIQNTIIGETFDLSQSTSILSNTHPSLLSKTTIRGNFRLKKTQLAGGLNMSNTIVQENFLIEDATQAGSITINDNSQINNQLSINDASLKELKIINSNITGAIYCKNLNIPILINYQDSNLNSIYVSNCNNTIELSIVNCVINSFFSITDSSNIELGILNSELKTGLLIERIKRLESFNIYESFIKVFSAEEIEWPTDKKELSLHNFRFNSIASSSTLEEFELLSTLAEASSINRSFYKNVELYFAKSGHTEFANNMYRMMRDRIASEKLKLFDPSTWLYYSWEKLMRITIDYGRSPERIFVFCLVPIIFGSCIFRKKRMEPFAPEECENIYNFYNSFWFSLDWFLPFINLGIREKWKLDKAHQQSWHAWYLRIHILIGWLLIPIGLAAITGLVS